MSLTNSQRKPTTNIRHKIPLLNVQTLGASCGYGEGATRDEAIADALMKAKATDPDARFSEFTGHVHFAGGVNC